MATKNFTKISNEAIDNLSANALKVYAKLINLSTRKNFEIRRDYVKHLVGMGEKTFAKAWRELKDFGLLIMNRTREGKKWLYEFTLSTVENKKTVKKKKSIPVDSNGEEPLNGQVHAEELLDSAAPELQDNDLHPIDPKEVELVSNETGLKKEKAAKLLKLADSKRILEVYEYSKDKADDLFSYMKSAIENNWSIKTKIRGKDFSSNYTSNNSKRLKACVVPAKKILDEISAIEEFFAEGVF